MRPSHLKTRYRHELSPRQREVIDFLAAGLTNAEIARRLGVSLDGAKYHVREILGKLGAESREEAVEIWREMPSRPGGWARAGLGVGWAGKVAVVAVAGGVAVLAAIAVAGLVWRDDADSPPQDALPTAAPSLAPTSTAAVTPPALADCTSTDVALSLETVDRVDHVLVRLSASGAARCRLLGQMLFGLGRPPVDPAPGYPPEANISRDLKVAIEFPFTGDLGAWRWENWCARPMPWVFWQVKLNAENGIQAAVGNDVFPPCRRPDEPTTLTRETFVTGLEGDATPDTACLRAGFSGWLCEFATSVAIDSVAGQQGLFPRRLSNDAFFLCDGTGSAPGLGSSDICLGKEANTSVRGYWLAPPGTPGAFVSQDRFEGAVKAALPTSTALAAAACAGGGGPCGQFAIVVGDRRSPAVALIFRLERGREPAIIGATIGGTLAPLESPLGNFEFTAFPGRE
ncbi:MAG: hypothetical protein C0506_09635 [Anaerolinea sp.]|nr:hypothetical protein [Anaerolinea sp.]